MNFQLAREIYGANPWFVDQSTLPSLLAILDHSRTGGKMENPEGKYNSPLYIPFSQDARKIRRPYQLDNNDSFSGVGLINLNGPITVGGGSSSYGMEELSEMMIKMNLDDRIVSFIILTNSGGGSSGAVEIMVDTINEIKKTKPVYGLIKKGGIAASAAFGILSPCNQIFAESKMSTVGSAGTMMQFEGMKANSKDNNGRKYIRLYAPASTEKNKGYEEALNNDNYKILVDQVLKPVNQNFLNMILSNRPILADTNFGNGHTVFAKDAVGTFIDGIKSFDEVFNLASSGLNLNKHDNKTRKSLNNNVKSKSNNMTIEELRNDHSDLYNSVFEKGVTQERERTGCWLAHIDTDQEMVVEGIKSGNEISATERETFLVKAATTGVLKNLEEESQRDLNPKEIKDTSKTVGNEEAEAFYAEIDKKLNLV